MTFQALDSILLIFVMIAIAIILLQFHQYKKKTKQFTTELFDIRKNFEQTIDMQKREISRQNYIISNYQKQIGKESINQIEEVEKITRQNDNESIVTDLTKEKETLEDEKRKFQEKNKKLWEQSIAVHKEMEKIDKIKKKIEYEHKQLTDSIIYAKRIQTALLPAENLFAQYLKEYFIYWQPRDIVSGDFYWIKKIDDYIIVVAADCTGHGVPGAFMSVLGIACLNEIHSRNKFIHADEVLEEMRILVKNSLKQTGKDFEEAKDGMDMALCIINQKENKLFFAGANNPLFLFRNNNITEIEATRNPVGIYLKERKFEMKEIDLQKNDIFYIFTDGYSDEFGGNGQKFKKVNFRKLLTDFNTQNIPLHEQKDFLNKTMTEWLGGKFNQIDDMLVIGFKII